MPRTAALNALQKRQRADAAVVYLSRSDRRRWWSRRARQKHPDAPQRRRAVHIVRRDHREPVRTVGLRLRAEAVRSAAASWTSSPTRPCRIDFFGDEIDSIRPLDDAALNGTDRQDGPNLKDVGQPESRVSFTRFRRTSHLLADSERTLKHSDEAVITKILGGLDEPSRIDALGHQPPEAAWMTPVRALSSCCATISASGLPNARSRWRHSRSRSSTKNSNCWRASGPTRERGYGNLCCSRPTRPRSNGCRTSSTRSARRTSRRIRVPLTLHAGFDHAAKACCYTDRPAGATASAADGP